MIRKLFIGFVLLGIAVHFDLHSQIFQPEYSRMLHGVYATVVDKTHNLIQLFINL